MRRSATYPLVLLLVVPGCHHAGSAAHLVAPAAHALAHGLAHAVKAPGVVKGAQAAHGLASHAAPEAAHLAEKVRPAFRVVADPCVNVQVYFPADVASLGPPVHPQPVRPAAAPPGPQTVLIVEADDQLRWYTATVLWGQGYSALEAKDASEAMLHAERFGAPIRLLIIDAHCPPEGGLELARRLMERHPEMKVLLLGKGKGDVAETAAPVLQAPFAPPVLAEKVRSVLDRPFSPAPSAPPS
jgi:CheY-like chemotaxis protein